MTNTDSIIKKNVMRRVYIIRVLRPFVSGGMLALAVLVGALWGIGREVWVAKVLANGPQDLLGHVQYFLYAFGHTHLAVQVLVVTMLIAIVYLARATARFFTNAMRFA